FLNLMVEVGIVKDVGEAYGKYMDMSCLDARNDLLAMPRRADWKEQLDSSGRLRRDARPASVVKAAQPIENLTRLVIEHKIRLIRAKR
ncbi:MAG: hypothetical protein IH840_18510, partial [Candidatus Heimdallarchaeota archaeon]|nr:hypothetical protein [Candidatus Heimdallarchaeota archaeon]